MAMHRGSTISIVLALAAVLLVTKVFGAPTGEDTQIVHLEARDTPQSGPNFEPAQDNPLLAPRAAVPDAEAWRDTHCHLEDKRDANAAAEAGPRSGPSCAGAGHRRRALENAAASNPDNRLEARDALGPGVDVEPGQDKPLLVPRAPAPDADADAEADADPNSFHDDIAERVQSGLDHQLLARTPPSNARPARKMWARRSMQMAQDQ